MRSKRVIQVFRVLVVLLGVGLGIALANFGADVYAEAHEGAKLPLFWQVISYGGLAVLGGALFLALNKQIAKHWITWAGAVERRFDKMGMNQITSSVVGLIIGLIVAALICRMFSFLGGGMFTTVLAAILYLVLGSLGFTVGRKRGNDFAAMLARFYGSREHGKSRRHASEATVPSDKGVSRKLLDTSAIIDGRIFEIQKTGFVEGKLTVPQFVVDELRHVADSSDAGKRERGRRGLDLLQAVKDSTTMDETDYADVADVDVKLLRLAKQTGAQVITCDYNLSKAAAVNEVRVLNVNELANAMRYTVVQGQTLTVKITREGREAGQGLAYMPDGTMLVIENGKNWIGTEKTVVVTSVLQTSAGRMIFAKMAEEEA